MNFKSSIHPTIKRTGELLTTEIVQSIKRAKRIGQGLQN